MDDDRLLELHRAGKSTESPLAVTVTPVLERLEMPEDSHIDWNVDERDQDPMLVFGRISEDEVSDAAYPRRLHDTDGEISAPVPDTLLSTDPPDGIGLERESYDPDNPLLFESIATGETVGLIPARFDDGTPFRREPLPETDTRSDPIAQAELERDDASDDPSPRPETIDAPIDAEVLETVVEKTDVSFKALSGVLEDLSRQRLVGESNAVGEYPPVAVDDRGICIVSNDEWEERLEPELSMDDSSVLEAARLVHNRQAKRLLAEIEDPEKRHRGFDEEYDAIVTDERETAEWDVTEAGSG